jgi:hypothetical protein
MREVNVPMSQKLPSILSMTHSIPKPAMKHLRNYHKGNIVISHTLIVSTVASLIQRLSFIVASNQNVDPSLKIKGVHPTAALSKPFTLDRPRHFCAFPLTNNYLLSTFTSL